MRLRLIQEVTSDSGSHIAILHKYKEQKDSEVSFLVDRFKEGSYVSSSCYDNILEAKLDCSRWCGK